MSSSWTFADIKSKIRKVTGRLSSNEMTETDLNDRTNKYYQFTFPAEVKLERQHTYFDFLTTVNQATYDFTAVTAPLVFTNVEPPATLDNLSMLYYQDPGRFNSENPQQITRGNMGTGNGAQVSFPTTVAGFPIMPGTTVITDNVEVFEDTNTTFSTTTQNITGSLGGLATVNYSTGAFNVTFLTPPANGQLIVLSYQIFQAGRPTAVLFYDHQFKFFVPPDTAYRFRMKGYQVVAALVNATDTPILSQWGPAIAYGTARGIHADFGEMDAYAEVTQLYNEQIDYVLTRTEQNLLNTRAAPFF